MGFFDRLDRLADQLGDLIAPDDVRAHVELGAGYLDRGDLGAAVHELSCALELQPEHARAAYLLGVARARQGDLDGALEALQRAAARNGSAEAHVALGEIHRRRDEHAAAAAAYRAALDAGVSDPALRGEIYRGMGAIHLSSGRFDKAVRELRKAIAAAPDDHEAQGLLGRALYARGDHETARLCLERAARVKEPEVATLTTLGETYAALGRDQEAGAAFERALALEGPSAVDARLGLGRLALATGDVRTAHDHALRALERAPHRPDLLVLYGRALAASGSFEQALAAFERALEGDAGAAESRLLFDRRPVLTEALRLALRAELVPRALAYANALLEIDPAHPDALAARVVAATVEDRVGEAVPLAEQALAAGETVEVRLAIAGLAVRQGDRVAAAASLRRAARLEPADPRPRERLAALYRLPTAPTELYGLLRLAHEQLSGCPEVASLAPEVGRLIEVLDRPLLVTVMGEFNSGKSTFVNALLGEEVAPMGITPTTATINVLRYGAERKGRVVYQDGTSREIPWAAVPQALAALDETEAARIRQVEVLVPLETLQRVNVVDTPGLNSINPAHERVARRFMSEADAVVWLFSVDQAAKATELEPLRRLRAEGTRVLGVLNKVDRCTPEEAARLVEHVRATVGELLEEVVPFSARGALAGRRAADPALLEGANHPALERALEQRFFSRARVLQDEACRIRLQAILERAAAAVVSGKVDERLDRLDAAARRVREEAERFRQELLARERRAWLESAEQAYQVCVAEVLDFVRPRRWAFGSNEATPADRDFLIGLLEERLGALLGASRLAVQEQLAQVLGEVREVDPAAVEGLTSMVHHGQVYDRFRAFARGYLRGGRVNDFFTRVLPKLELEEVAVRRALERLAPWQDDLLESELRAPLRDWAEQLFASLAERLARLRSAVELERFDVEARVLTPIETLRAALPEPS